MELVRFEKVVVLVNASRQRVFNRDHAAIRTPLVHSVEHVLEGVARYGFAANPEQAARGKFTIRARHSLKGDFHEANCST